MIITGWRVGANTVGAIKAVHKHTNMPLSEAKRLIEDAVEGKIITLPDDFVLREDLEDCNFIVK